MKQSIGLVMLSASLGASGAQAQVPAVGALGTHNVLDMRVRTADFHTVEDTWLALSMLPGLWPHTPLPRRTPHLPYVVSCLVLSTYISNT